MQTKLEKALMQKVSSKKPFRITLENYTHPNQVFITDYSIVKYTNFWTGDIIIVVYLGRLLFVECEGIETIKNNEVHLSVRIITKKEKQLPFLKSTVSTMIPANSIRGVLRPI